MSFWIQNDLTFNEEEHEYQWKGKAVTGVTSILGNVGIRTFDKKGVERWSPIGFNDQWVGDDTAANFGVALHKIAEAIIQNFDVNYPESMEPWVRSLRSFLHDYPLVPLTDLNGNPLTEYPMYSERYKYAGTPDLVGMTNKDDVWLVDWKTADSFQKHWNLQTAAYENLLREVFKIKKKITRVIVQITADKYIPNFRSGHPEDWSGFLSANNVLRMAA